ncbi:MAG: type secretion system-associated domain protein TagH, partial [Pseudomonadota bacterium]
MILLTVKSYNGAPTDVAPASFDELGGTIGRADNNHLVLPDPERTISRVHAKVSYRADGYTIVDNGSNPISINGSPLGSGREHVLAAGDQVQIGGYVLVVSQGQGGKGGGAFDDLFSDVDDGLAAPAANPQHTRSVLHTWAPDPAVSRNGGSAGGLSPGQIPHDWDPFADEGGTGMQAPGGAGRAPMSDPLMAGASQSSRDFAAQAPSNLGRGGLGETAPAGADSLDHLFDLSAAPAGVDPLGGDVQQMQRMQPNMAGHADPLQALSRPAAYGAESF